MSRLPRPARMVAPAWPGTALLVRKKYQAANAISTSQESNTSSQVCGFPIACNCEERAGGLLSPHFFAPQPSRNAPGGSPKTATCALDTICDFAAGSYSSRSHSPTAVRLRREDAYFILAVALCNRSATAHQRSCLGMVHSIHTRAFPGILSGVW